MRREKKKELLKGRIVRNRTGKGSPSGDEKKKRKKVSRKTRLPPGQMQKTFKKKRVAIGLGLEGVRYLETQLHVKSHLKTRVERKGEECS